jgi:hypothetical protein
MFLFLKIQFEAYFIFLFKNKTTRADARVAFSDKGGRPDSNRRPPEPQSGALTI